MINLLALRAFSDNSIWMLHDGRQAVVVDPGADAPLKAAPAALDLRLASILVTHHAADPIGGLGPTRPTLASTIGLERRIDPSLRCDLPEACASARAQGLPLTTL